MQCAYTLAKNGFKVTVLEQHSQIGGCLQSFQRDGCFFDTGFHYVGGLGQGESLYPFFRYYNLLSLPWHPLDENGHDEVCIGSQSFRMASGHQRFASQLSAYFPTERKSIIAYTDFLRKVGEHLPQSLHFEENSDFSTAKLLEQSAYQFLQTCTGNRLLQNVLSGTSLTMELQADTLPLYSFAQINNSYIQSAWRLKGPSEQIPLHLAEDILWMGGEIRTSSKVVQIEEKDKQITALRLSNGERLSADYYISDVHPATTLSWLSEETSVRKIYRNRIRQTANTFGMFTLHLRLKNQRIPYLNRNIYIHREQADLWNPDTKQIESAMVHFYVPENADYASAIDILTSMHWQQVEQWTDSYSKKNEYQSFKEEKTEECLQFVAERLPALKDSILQSYCSTPLTYARFTGSFQGSAYGIRKDYQHIPSTVLSTKSPLGNLFYTGQNLNLHGILGVSITSFLTCAEILGKDTLLTQLKLTD